MAGIGLRYAAFAPVTSHTDGSAITYGTGREVGMMIDATVTITRNSNKLHANDVVAEEDNSISEASVAVEMDDLTLDNEAFMLGTAKVTVDNVSHYQDTDDPSPLGGFGYVRVRSKTDQTTGVTSKSYIATWWYKVRARIESEEGKTKGDNIEWATPKLVLRAMGAYIDSTGKLKFRDRQSFETYASAKAFIDAYANISSGSSSSSSSGTGN